MRHLATLGREAGLHEFTAEVLSENVPMLNVFERSGLAMSTERDGTVMHVTFRWRSGRDRNALTTIVVRRKSRGSGVD